MLTAAITVHIFVSFVLVVSVLLHTGKGAGMGSSFGGSTSSQTIFGSAGPATLFTKITAACAVVFMITSIYITYNYSHRDTASIMRDVPAIRETPTEESEPVPVIPPITKPLELDEKPEAKAKAATTTVEDKEPSLGAAPAATEEKPATKEEDKKTEEKKK